MSLQKPILAIAGATLAAMLSACGGGGSSGVATPDPSAAAAMNPPAPYSPPWQTVANSATVIPGGGDRLFNSFNQPSVNSAGIVALRGRSKGAQGLGEPLRGIYMRDMGTGGALQVVFDTAMPVPQPNNVLYDGLPGTFTEFPAFPRIGLDSATVVTRGQSKPVWSYLLPDGTETRVGTSGVYALRLGEARTAASQLGLVPGFEQFSVPGAAPGTKFDQFPGAPAVASPLVVVFKGNYTETNPKTGIFFRDTRDGARPAMTQVIASSDTLIPGQPEGGTRFGSTAPPSAAGDYAVFLGVDNEEAPTLGGIYRAPLASKPKLQLLVGIGAQVPGEAEGATFTRLGEALSFDGQFVAFWGAWGTATRTIHLSCPVDGQQAVIAYCNQQYPEGYDVQEPVNQGIFLHDLKSGRAFAVAKTGADYAGFLYWTFSGRPPGVGESDAEDFEPPRWRSAAFATAFADKSKEGQVGFKARKAGAPVVDGIYLATVATDGKTAPSITTLAETGMPGRQLDPAAPENSAIVALGIEREGLRNGWLAIVASMLDSATSESWAGIYLTRTRR
jgi:hypothetical protein